MRGQLVEAITAAASCQNAVGSCARAHSACQLPHSGRGNAQKIHLRPAGLPGPAKSFFFCLHIYTSARLSSIYYTMEPGDFPSHFLRFALHSVRFSTAPPMHLHPSAGSVAMLHRRAVDLFFTLPVYEGSFLLYNNGNGGGSMHCLKCGTEIEAPQVFCDRCLVDMKNHPVSRETPRGHSQASGRGPGAAGEATYKATEGGGAPGCHAQTATAAGANLCGFILHLPGSVGSAAFFALLRLCQPNHRAKLCDKRHATQPMTPAGFT